MQVFFKLTFTLLFALCFVQTKLVAQQDLGARVAGTYAGNLSLLFSPDPENAERVPVNMIVVRRSNTQVAIHANATSEPPLIVNLSKGEDPMEGSPRIDINFKDQVIEGITYSHYQMEMGLQPAFSIEGDRLVLLFTMSEGTDKQTLQFIGNK
ncbi:MAG: hypothetical protein JJT94_10480 [Bernardetiaceae bacterium]|nr:hypothetical protein [Bernardetiaceae bacterium]